MSSAIEAIMAERQRQITEEGFTAEHDDDHMNGELAAAAACYANPLSIVVDGSGVEMGIPNTGTLPLGWPEGWASYWWKEEERRKSLVKAGALIIAEIERLDRLKDLERCPICDEVFKPDDICATDITEGCCHAECLAGSPVVDLETGEETGGEVRTFTFAEICSKDPKA